MPLELVDTEPDRTCETVVFLLRHYSHFQEVIFARTLRTVVRGHYTDPQITAQRIASLGATETAKIVREQLPSTQRARSGDMGEILATELAENELQYSVPIRRLRWKDGRNTALRGDDLIGVIDGDITLRLLKGESKSRAALSSTTVKEAGETLDMNRGRPHRHSVIFVANCLRQQSREALAQKLEEAALNGFRSASVAHMLFVLSGNSPGRLLSQHLKSIAARRARIRYAVGVQIPDHREFIQELFEELPHAGNPTGAPQANTGSDSAGNAGSPVG